MESKPYAWTVRHHSDRLSQIERIETMVACLVATVARRSKFMHTIATGAVEL